MIHCFTKEVIDKLEYYVYRLIDPRTGQTFYVGKGTGNRVFDHVKCQLKFDSKHKKDEEDEEDEVSAKIQQIRDIQKSGLEVIHIIHRYGMSEETAFEVEAAVMDCYYGLTNIQAGHASDRGACNAELVQRSLSAEEFQDDPNLVYCIIKVKQAVIDERNSIYEAARKHWRVNMKRMSKVQYVLASVNGMVAEVFSVERWLDSDEVTGRKMFEGKRAPEEIRSQFVEKRLPKQYMVKGNAAPVLYHNA